MTLVGVICFHMITVIRRNTTNAKIDKLINSNFLFGRASIILELLDVVQLNLLLTARLGMHHIRMMQKINLINPIQTLNNSVRVSYPLTQRTSFVTMISE